MDFSQKLFFLFGAFFGLLAVAAGAFGSHALKSRLTPDSLNIFEIGVRYQMYHALALLFLGCLYAIFSHQLLHYSGWSFILGTLIFSGSLYILVLSGVRAWGAITPIGGLLLILGWLFLLISIFLGK